MKYVLFFLLVVINCVCLSNPSERIVFKTTTHTMETKNYSMNIKHNCSEGCVSCNNIILILLSKKTNDITKLMGSTRHTMGVDGVTPSRFLGYVFERDGKTYHILEGGIFKIVEGDAIILVKEKWKLKGQIPN